jgi:adenine-specific DNA-methyltransferase
MYITKTELVWPGKYNDDGSLREMQRVSLPFQVIETVNESRATRESQKVTSMGLFDVYEGREGDTFEAGWRNKVIWGDNLLVMGSLLDRFGGRVDLVYIDPPFLTGADFSYIAPVGEGGLSIEKEASVIEEKAYRDTWGQGIDSYLAMLAPRIQSIWQLLRDGGNMFLHIGPSISHNVRSLCDDILGAETFRSGSSRRRSLARPSPRQARRCIRGHGDVNSDDQNPVWTGCRTTFYSPKSRLPPGRPKSSPA